MVKKRDIVNLMAIKKLPTIAGKMKDWLKIKQVRE